MKVGGAIIYLIFVVFLCVAASLTVEYIKEKNHDSIFDHKNTTIEYSCIDYQGDIYIDCNCSYQPSEA